MASVRSAIVVLAVAYFFADGVGAHRTISNRVKCYQSEQTIYDENHRFTTLQNNTEVELSQYRGATVQYLPLNALQTEGLTVLGFPCNQFGLQEPGKNSEILNTLRYVRPGNGFIPNFPVFEKVEVNGDNAHPFFVFMKNQCPGVTTRFAPSARLFYEPIRPNDIEWNFHKFLIDHDGKVHRRYNHFIAPDSPLLQKDIAYLLRRRKAALTAT